MQTIHELADFVLDKKDSDDLKDSLAHEAYGKDSYLMNALGEFTTLAYFDHKLPDTLSSATLLFLRALAPLPDGRIKAFSLIQGCSLQDYGISETYADKDFVPTPDEHVATHCPDAYYKRIQYTMNELNIKTAGHALQG